MAEVEEEIKLGTEEFSTQMRKFTRKVHQISDSLVNAKLLLSISMGDDTIWADGLLTFYEIFKFLENHVPADILPITFHRAIHFQNDLKFYLGDDWERDYQIRPEVEEYLSHLEDIYEKKPILLMAYVYHLYMGLLSGGQILQKKRSIEIKIGLKKSNNDNSHEGEEVTNFDFSEPKRILRKIVNDKAESLDDETKIELLKESKIVFELNNIIIKTVKSSKCSSTNYAFYIIVFTILISMVIGWLIKKLILNYANTVN